ncbi:MAG TPA: glucose 1-dehydrogenase [Chloroflexota bacterium]|jgi:NAD(P)-dependent dehydrogenase (short-subunit alcohol dehydrogenase family)|nr:glucose 1-dehydrogenase [Chloroflexota bacterium]
MRRLAGQVALITGGASGIGRAIALLFAAEGARLLLADRQAEAGATVLTAIRQAGGEARFCAVDLAASGSAAEVVAATLERYGRLDVVVNNAAVSSPDGILGVDEAQWEQTLAVDLKAPFFLTQAALPAMLAQRHGVFVNIASVNALLGLGNEAYSAAKAGLVSLTRSVATRHGPDGIRANAICPGTVRTPIWQATVERTPNVFAQLARWYPLGRVGEPEDIARAALFLASEEASWISGAVLPVDGGLTAGLHRMAVELQGE